jgi:hypothetical protein
MDCACMLDVLLVYWARLFHFNSKHLDQKTFHGCMIVATCFKIAESGFSYVMLKRKQDLF